MTQAQLAELANMAQPRISAMERPGETAFTIETLVRLAAAFKVGLKVEFVPFSEMLQWENNYSQDDFSVVQLDQDQAFLNPAPTPVHSRRMVSTPIWNQSWRELQPSLDFEQKSGLVYACYKKLSAAENISTGTSGFSYVESANPVRTSTDIQATPSFPPADLISVQAASLTIQ